MYFIDLSHIIEDGVITYKGLPAPIICDYISREASKAFYEDGTTFQIGKIEMVSNTGTYIDSPFHRYADGKDLSQLELGNLANLPAIRIDARDKMAIDVSSFSGFALEGKAVLIETGWSSNWNTDRYYEDHPFVTEAAARFLLEQKVCLVGIDSHNIDDTRKNSRPVHSILLKNNIAIVEHLCNLSAIPVKEGFFFTAVPPKIKGFGTFPVRAFATIHE
ncbi:MAG: cyclase family protein [Bacteroidota bacterium]